MRVRDWVIPLAAALGVIAAAHFAGAQMLGGSFVTPGNTVLPGPMTISSGGLTITAGGETITAGGLTVTAGGITVSAGQTLLPNGNVAAPSVAFNSDPGTGIYQPAASQVAVSIAGTQSATFQLSNLNLAGGYGLIWGADNTANIGAFGASRPSNIYVGSTVFTTAPNTQAGATYAVIATDNYLIANTAGGLTVTLPTPSSNTGRALWIRTIANGNVASVSSNVVPLAGGAAQANILIATAGKWALLVSDGSNWQITAAN